MLTRDSVSARSRAPRARRRMRHGPPRAPRRCPVNAYHEDFLYDLDADPHERDNFVADPAHAQVRAELREKLIQSLNWSRGLFSCYVGTIV